MRKKRLLLWLVIGAAATAAAAWWPVAPAPTVTAAREPMARKQSEPLRGEDRLAALPQREAIGKGGSNLFAAQSWGPAPVSTAAAPAPAAQPTAPAMPYRVAGTVSQGGATQIVLARGTAILTVREGDTLDEGYRVESIQPDRVTLVYLPLGSREELAVNSTLAANQPARLAQAAAGAPAPAQEPAKLRWEGPLRVSAGSTFDVALKLTSAEAVRAAPLQLSFDADVVEAISVRAGGFFSDGLFSYRVNPGGSIFIGASGKGSVPSDAEFVVVRFKTIRGPGTAELKVSSISLQDPSGRVIAHQQPASFRTVIGQ